MPTPNKKSLTGGLMVQNNQQLLKDVNDAFFGGGQATPATPTPTPTPTPKDNRNFLARLLGLS